jgi:TM2 domain-containing membrane protein YozV
MDNSPDVISTDSDKSYFVSVCLAGIFGTLGVHHFYLGRWLHGTFDLTMAILTVIFIFIFFPIAMLILLIDFVHTVYVTYKLVIGEYKDGSGRTVSVPR